MRCKRPQLAFEFKIYDILRDGEGIPKVHWFGNEGKYTILIIDLLGPNLKDLFEFCQSKFSLKTTLILAEQMITRIEYIHSKNFIHRDIKPENFLIGLGKNTYKLHIIDFGLSKKYRDIKTFQHIPYKENKTLIGTARYVSINTHLGIEQSRRDDLESIGYLFIYFLKGRLPWQERKAKFSTNQKIMEKKMAIPIEYLCLGLPQEFANYLHYCRSLRFEDRPDYSNIRKTFRELFIRENYSNDYAYDWTFVDNGSNTASRQSSFKQDALNPRKGTEPLANSKTKDYSLAIPQNIEEIKNSTTTKENKEEKNMAANHEEIKENDINLEVLPAIMINQEKPDAIESKQPVELLLPLSIHETKEPAILKEKGSDLPPTTIQKSFLDQLLLESILMIKCQQRANRLMEKGRRKGRTI